MVRSTLIALASLCTAALALAAGPQRDPERAGEAWLADGRGTPVASAKSAESDPSQPVIPVQSVLFPGSSLFLDPNPYVVTKEFSFFHNGVPDTTVRPEHVRGMFHLMYQRSAGPQRQETAFGHAWSKDLVNWLVDTLAFTVDGTPWNSAHVWSPSLIRHGSKDYMFYTGVDAQNDQRIGYASTDQLDTTNTVWDAERVMVWEASRTRWAVPDPWTYSGQSQLRDPFVVADPDHPGRLLMFYAAHDSIDFRAGRAGLVVGVARSEPGTVGAWADLGYYPSTLTSVTNVWQLEGPHAFPVRGTNAGWRLMFSNAGSPAGESGNSTIRFETLRPGASLSDTTASHWGAPRVLKQYLNGDPNVFGWSGSEHLRVADVDYLAGFTAWGPLYQGIAISRMSWNGSEFTLGRPTVTAVDEFRSPTRGLGMRVIDETQSARRVVLQITSALELEASLELFDAMGRRVRSLLAGTLPVGTTNVPWDLASGDGGSVPSGVYFARLSFAGGVRAACIPVVR